MDRRDPNPPPRRWQKGQQVIWTRYCWATRDSIHGALLQVVRALEILKGPAVTERTFCTTRGPLHQKGIWETPKKFRSTWTFWKRTKESGGGGVVGRQTQSLALCSDCSNDPAICYTKKLLCEVLERRHARSATLSTLLIFGTQYFLTLSCFQNVAQYLVRYVRF